MLTKAEVARHPRRKPKNNPRFVVTNLIGALRHLYEQIYFACSDVEGRIKEMHHGLEIDRTGCRHFVAKSTLLTAAGYVLLTGPTGVGKSYLASALAHAACRAGFSVGCLRLSRRVDELTRSSAVLKRSAYFRHRTTVICRCSMNSVSRRLPIKRCAIC